jgi:N-acetylmuramoyl-L-alanine amidase
MKKFVVYSLISVTIAAGNVRADSLKLAEAPVASPALTTGNGKVLKDNVNIRARADKNAEVIAQLKKGDTVEVLDRKGEWLRITAPATAKCYVSSKFIKDGVITGDAINVRCGPGTNFRDIGKLSKGDKVAVVETKGEWSQIQPTANCSGWVAAELIEVSVPTPPPAPIQTSDVAPATVPLSAPIEPAPVAAANSDDVIIQYVVKDGYLQIVKEPNAPGQYVLMTESVMGREYIIAYLESSHSNLSRHAGRHVRVMGNQKWKRDERYPVITIERCEPVL